MSVRLVKVKHFSFAVFALLTLLVFYVYETPFLDSRRRRGEDGPRRGLVAMTGSGRINEQLTRCS